MLKDVQHLKDMHREQHKGRGRPQSVLTRSAIFLLCAAWELYTEDVIKESFDFVISRHDDPNDLPIQIKKTLAAAVSADKHAFAALRLARDGWKRYLSEHVEKKIAELNTPSAKNVSELFETLVGIDVSEILRTSDSKLSAFIGKRGDIAHRGADAGHISISNLDSDYVFICGLVVDLDNYLVDPIKKICGARPWNTRLAS